MKELNLPETNAFCEEILKTVKDSGMYFITNLAPSCNQLYTSYTVPRVKFEDAVWDFVEKYNDFKPEKKNIEQETAVDNLRWQIIDTMVKERVLGRDYYVRTSKKHYIPGDPNWQQGHPIYYLNLKNEMVQKFFDVNQMRDHLYQCRMYVDKVCRASAQDSVSKTAKESGEVNLDKLYREVYDYTYLQCMRGQYVK